MDPPTKSSSGTLSSLVEAKPKTSRSESISAASADSQTAAEFIDSQLKLEADAREALPYKFDTCTRPLGALRQLLFACLTCNPPPSSPSELYNPAGVCYSCSVSCHGEHTLVELFNKRNFVCDCGTTRMPATSPCNLRLDPLTNQKGNVVSEPAEVNNKYNQNFQNRFCGCECDYDAHQQKGTMFQCLGLGTVEEGGCGEDWYHPACVVGLSLDWYENQKILQKLKPAEMGGFLETITEVASAVTGNKDQSTSNIPEAGGLLDTITDVASAVVDQRNSSSDQHPELDKTSKSDSGSDEDNTPTPPGFPQEDDFEGFICYKCVDSNPWIKRYAGTRGFLEPVFIRSNAPSPEAQTLASGTPQGMKSATEIFGGPTANSAKRNLEDEADKVDRVKRLKDETADLDARSVFTETTDELKKAGQSGNVPDEAIVVCKYQLLPAAPEGRLSLFFKADFRSHLCRCADCFPRLSRHPQLLEEEDTYEPPVSEGGDVDGGSTVGSGSIYDRGENALKNVDRVRAIEGVMAYNHLKEKLKPFFKEFAESGKAISAEDIKAYFAKMRGDEEAIKQAGENAASSADNRREQSGY